MSTMTKFKWFWAWDDEKEEGWLRAMAQQGWHLAQVGFPNLYTFEQGSPADVVYRLDFFTNHKDKSAYLQLFADAGWEHIGEYGSWQYFRKEAVPGEANEIFTDNESKIKKYQRVLAVLVIPIALLIIAIINRTNRGEGVFFEALTLVWFILIILICYGAVRLLRRIGQLKRR